MGIVTTARGKLYVRHMKGGRIRDGMDAVEIADLVRHAYACGRRDGEPRPGGRPTNEQRALKALRADPELLRHVLDGTPLAPLGSAAHAGQQTDSDNPHAWPTWTPDEAIRATLDSMPPGRTRDGYASALNKQADALGRETFDTWVDRWWGWLYEEYPNENTQQNHISAANRVLKHSSSKAVRKFVPNFKHNADRPARTKAAKRKAQRLKKDATPYSVEEMVALTNTAYLLWSPDHYSCIVEHICALAGMHIGDALVMLGGWSSTGRAKDTGCSRCDGRGCVENNGGRATDCTHCTDWGFQWDGKGGLSWYSGYRVKTCERICIPIAPALATLLRPLAHGRGLKYQGKPGHGTSGRLPLSGQQHREAHYAIEAKAGVKRIKGQSFKRFRTGFQRVLENDLQLPKPVRQRLIAHQVGDDDAIGAYAAVLDRELVDAILAYGKLLLAAGREAT